SSRAVRNVTASVLMDGAKSSLHVGLVLAGGTIGGRCESGGTVAEGDSSAVRDAFVRLLGPERHDIDIPFVYRAYDGLSETIGSEHWVRIGTAVQNAI